MSRLVYEQHTILDFLEKAALHNAAPMEQRAYGNQNITQVSLSRNEWLSFIHLVDMNYNDLAEYAVMEGDNPSSAIYKNIQVYYDGGQDSEMGYSHMMDSVRIITPEERAERNGQRQANPRANGGVRVATPRTMYFDPAEATATVATNFAVGTGTNF